MFRAQCYGLHSEGKYARQERKESPEESYTASRFKLRTQPGDRSARVSPDNARRTGSGKDGAVRMLRFEAARSPPHSRHTACVCRMLQVHVCSSEVICLLSVYLRRRVYIFRNDVVKLFV